MSRVTVLPFVKLARQVADKPLFIFEDGLGDVISVDGNALAKNVETLGSEIQAVAGAQEKAVLIFPQGMEYIYSVLACLYSNVIAIPTPIPRSAVGSQIAAQIQQILLDSQARFILTDSSLFAELQAAPEFAAQTVLNVEQLLERAPVIQHARAREDDDIGILLYTSGSISQPKGIRLSHGNLASRAAKSAAQWEVSRDSRIVSWMPQFHSFGLELNFMIPLSQGATSVILTPATYVRSPAEWFKAIDKYQATHTGSPNFAFDTCYSAIELDAVQGVSLASLQAIMCGGEPVSKDTYEKFTTKFAALGLKPHVLCGHYGLSEVGSVITKNPAEPARFLALDSASLQQGKVQPASKGAAQKFVASCGQLWPDIEVRIVHPETLVLCPPGEVGEIWVKSASVGLGYLNRDEESLRTFGGELNDGSEGGFLRSGDMGFVEDRHVYIVGREKEVVIINGKNHYPADIEWTVKKHLPELTLAVAAFSSVVDEQEKIVVVQELEAELDAAQYKKLVRKIVAAVSETHQVEVYEISFVARGLIPKTGSGKLQRSVCKRAYLNHEIAVLYQYNSQARKPAPAVVAAQPARPALSSHQIIDTLKREVFLPALDVEAAELDEVDALSELGLDSIKYVQLAKRIEEVFGSAFEPSLFFKHRNFAEVAAYIADQLHGAPAAKPVTAKPVAKPARDLQHTDIAVIGMSGNFPGGAGSLEQFWNNLLQGKDCVTAIPESRVEFFKGLGAAYAYPKWGGFIDDVAGFDASFFGISPLEAESMDPQQRKMLQLTWQLFESSGYNPKQLAGQDIAVFVGAHNNDYLDLVRAQPGLMDIYGAFLESGLHMSMIANRVSRWFDFHGPSEVINTACSSSLVAVNHAVESLLCGETSLAMAAGINLILSPRVYIGSHKAAMLSEDGRCKTFDQSANGFVRAEGYGAVLLKPYSQALEDGDTIYGVIKGTYVNHDGKSNSLRAPNMNAQKRLIADAYQQVGLPINSISYIEAHGTGTSLGDPIEVQALKEGFAEASADLPSAFCGLGTLKTNIGHAESAAGIGGLIKVLLSMRHATLPGVLHYQQLNPYISLQDSPFYIVDRTRPWPRPSAPDGTPLPLRAGVSSFGFGGVNAHVVLEEFPAEAQGSQFAISHAQPALIVLSAKTEERLVAQAEQLAAVIRSGALQESGLASVAYTLQVGREAMEERLALAVASLSELEQALSAFAAGKTGSTRLYRGQTKRDKDALALFSADEDMAGVIDTWIAKHKVEKLLEFWVKGLALDWSKLYSGQTPRRIGLPTYPFANDQYWVPTLDETASAQSGGLAVLHPLLQQNTSDLTGPRFSSTFSGAEFFLADHRIQGESLLPGAVYLEMARAALVQASGAAAGQSGVRLKNIGWSRPLKADGQPLQVHIGLYPEDSGEIAYEIYSEPQDAEPLVHSQGQALLIASDTAQLDISALQAQCTQRQVSGADCYATFRKLGLEYGAAHQAISVLHIGAEQVLAKLELPASVTNTQSQFVLHPSLMDAALQASMGFALEQDQPLALPFALQELEVFRACSASMWAVVRRSAGSQAQDKVQKFDIDVCDAQGLLCVCLKGFSTRVMAAAEAVSGTLLLHPSWSAQEVAPSTAAPAYAQHVAILCDVEGVTSEQIQIDGLRCLRWDAPRNGIGEDFQLFAERAIVEVQTLLQVRGQTLIQIVAPAFGKQQLLAGLAGLLKTAHLENPKLFGQLISVDAGVDAAALTEILKANAGSSEQQVRYQDGERWVAGWKEVTDAAVKQPWKDNGVYLITGGAGGLGLIFAKEIAQRTQGATLVLTGRSALSADKLHKLQELQALGAQVEYLQVDVADKDAVAGLIGQIQYDHSTLNGIIHSAGVTRDSFILKKTQQELREVLAGKVAGVVNLDEASKDMALDCFICFSSVAAQGHVGQADYAMANAFMDAYAAYRNSLVAIEQRHGQTLSVNWPLWREGGMGVDAASESRMLESTGMVAMASSAGIQALYRSLAADQDQVRVMEGRLAQLRATFLAAPAVAATVVATSVAQVASSGMADKAVGYFKQLLSSVLRLPAHKIDADAPMEQYGIDSILVMQLTAELEKVFGSLSKTLFFEYQTIRLLTEYFVESYGAQLTALLGAEQTPAQPLPTVAVPVVQAESAGRNRRRARFTSSAIAPQAAPDKPLQSMDVAIIGVSGRYAQAQNLQQFWDNLSSGKDCISEIPSGRWDHTQYFDPIKGKPGKAYSKWGGFIGGVDQFDPLFFNISPREAETMDPQERLFLEEAYASIEDAGYSPARLSASRKVGVFVGVMNGRYPSGARFWSIANRVSYLLNLQGPSIALDTACSSSLVAIHLALESLYSGTSECAIAGGVNLIVNPSHYLDLSAMTMLSASDKCRPFGDQADGFVDGEGVGAVLLKPLKQAEADGDHIYGVIKGSMVNSGGKTNGFTVPNPVAQARLVADALERSGVHARTVSYLEAHGTGTALGDPIEIAGLSRAFHEHTADKQFCVIGSAKGNIGHCESAAGIAGVSKVLLQLKHRQLAPSLHSQQLNQNINFANTPFAVQQQLADWPRPVLEIDGVSKEYPRIAGVSSFGAGGVNAHVVIEEYIPQQPVRPAVAINQSNPALIVLSGKTSERLAVKAEQLLAALSSGVWAESDLADIAYTLQTGREAMEERLALQVVSLTELKAKLAAFIAGQDEIEHLYLGQIKRNKDALSVFAQDEDMANVVEAWVAKKKYTQLLELWVKGMAFDWSKLYGENKPRRVSLPSYPFAKQRYWMDAPDQQQPVVADGVVIEHNAEQSVSQTITRLVSQLMKIQLEDIDGNADFYEYGFDSISLTQLAGELNQHLGLQLTPLVFFEHSTINRLASHLKTNVAEAARGAAVAVTATIQTGLSRMVVAGSQPIPVALYYPSRSPAQNIAMGAFSPTVALDGALPERVKGLILISHCTGGSELGHHNLAQRLAEQGYLVAALQHPGDNWHDRSLTTSPTFFAERTRQLSLVLDALLADAQWAGKIPVGRIGAIGHSAGGGSVLALAGGVIRPTLLDAHCARLPEDDAAFCSMFGGDSHVDAPDADAADRRIRAALLMTPVGVVFTPESLARIKLPLKIYAAQHDAVLANAHHADLLRAQLPQADFEMVENAGHFSFLAQANRVVAGELGDWADPAGFNRAAFLARLEQEVTDFFDTQLAPTPTDSGGGGKPKQVVLFPGQGAQFKGMGKDLFPLYPELTRRASEILGYSIEELCLADPDNKLGLTQYTQPALYVVNALGYYQQRGAQGAGLQPTFLAGHSLGEYNALLAAGVFDFETGLKLVQKRGELMGAASGGGMAALLGVEEGQVKALLAEHKLDAIDLANYNTPTQFIVAGQKEALLKLEAICAKQGIRYLPLKVSAPFHSRYMQAAQQEFAAFIQGFTFQPPAIPVIANLSARVYEAETLAHTLSQQIANPVRWSQSIRYLLQQGAAEFIEVGGSMLGRMVAEIKQAEAAQAAEFIK